MCAPCFKISRFVVRASVRHGTANVFLFSHSLSRHLSRPLVLSPPPPHPPLPTPPSLPSIHPSHPSLLSPGPPNPMSSYELSYPDPDPPPAPAPSKASLLKWWNVFKKQSPSHEQEQEQGQGRMIPPAYRPPGRGLSVGGGGEGAHENKNKVFGVELERSLKFAGVAISMVGP